VVIKSVPPDSVVVGIPGRIVVRSKPRPTALPDLDHGLLPDVISETLTSLMFHIEELENRINSHTDAHPIPHTPDHGIWRGEDFSI
jgi:serine O-acetyltransferase